MIIGVVTAVVAGIAMAGNGYAAAAIGVPLGLGSLALLVWLFTIVSFAPVAVVLERKPVFAAFAFARAGAQRILASAGESACWPWVVAGRCPPRCRSVRDRDDGGGIASSLSTAAIPLAATANMVGLIIGRSS